MYFHGTGFVEHYGNRDIYYTGDCFCVVIPASYSVCSVLETCRRSLEECHEYIDRLQE